MSIDPVAKLYICVLKVLCHVISRGPEIVYRFAKTNQKASALLK
jgi:hypothetical protein